MPRTAEGGPHIAWPLITIFASLGCIFWWQGQLEKIRTESWGSFWVTSCFPCLVSGGGSSWTISAISWTFSMKCWLAVCSLCHLEQYTASQRIRSHSRIQPIWTYNLSAIIHCKQGDRVPKISMAGWLAHVSHIFGGTCMTVCYINMLWLSLTVKNYQPPSINSLWLSAHRLSVGVQIQLFVRHETFI